MKQNNNIGKKRKANKMNQGITLLTSENEDDKSKKNSMKSKRLTKM